MSSKNGYEIRLEILQIAQTQAWQEYHAEVESARMSHDDDTIKKAVDNFPQEGDILDIADKLYDFVSRK